MKTRSLFDRFNQSARKANDPHLELWKKWDDGGRKEPHLEPLMDALEPTVQQYAKKMHKGIGGSIPYSAVEAQVRIATKKGLDSYDPDKGTKVRTWVIGGLKQTSTFLAKNRNFAGVPKPRFQQFQRFQNAKNEFIATHGHEPTFEDMKVMLPDIPESSLRPMMTEFRREIFIGGNPDPEAADDSSLGHPPSQIRTIISLMPALLTPEEKKVFDHLYPTTGSPASIAQISKKTGLSQNQIYRIRAAIYKKAKPHLGNI